MKKIALITGTRADYGLLKPLIKMLLEDKSFDLSIIATGMHLSEKHGYTLNEILNDGYDVSYRVNSEINGDTAFDITLSMGATLTGVTKALEQISPEIVIVLGDRTEILSACIAASVLCIPVAHIAGGEKTEGAHDEAIRHSITKMSHLHFVATEEYRKRVIQLGESPETVFNVGALGIDSVKGLKLMSREEFEKSINFKLNKKNILTTFHPVTLEKDSAKKHMEELLAALDKLSETNLIFTMPNSDKGNSEIADLISQYVAANSDKAIVVNSLGQLRYLSALQFVDVVVGNSSSGLTEVPYFEIPTVNIGDRQKGRLAPESVIHCLPVQIEITKGILRAYDPTFIKNVKEQKQLYGDGKASEKIVKVLKNCRQIEIKKVFYDIKF